MLSTPEVRSVPQAAAAVRGLILLRNTTLPLVDLRTLFGLPTMASEAQAFVSMFEQREEDHRRWLNELESSVRENRPFTLTTDPYACAFGRWYDTFKTSNLLLEAVLNRFDGPHKRIHALGRDGGQGVRLRARPRRRAARRLFDTPVQWTRVVAVGLLHLAFPTLGSGNHEGAMDTKRIPSSSFCLPSHQPSWSFVPSWFRRRQESDAGSRRRPVPHPRPGRRNRRA